MAEVWRSGFRLNKRKYFVYCLFLFLIRIELFWLRINIGCLFGPLFLEWLFATGATTSVTSVSVLLTLHAIGRCV